MANKKKYDKKNSDAIKKILNEQFILPSWLPACTGDYYHKQFFALNSKQIPKGMKTVLPAFTCQDTMEHVWERLIICGDKIMFGYIDMIILVETTLYNLAYNNKATNMRSIKHRDKVIEHLLESIKNTKEAYNESIKMQRFIGDFRGFTDRCDVLAKEMEKVNILIDDIKNYDGGEVKLNSLHPSMLANKQSFHKDTKHLFMARQLKQYCINKNISKYSEIVYNTVNTIYGTSYTSNNIHNLK